MNSPYANRPWTRHYDYWIPREMRYPERPLHDILDTTAVDFPDNQATAFFGATLTFAEIKDRSDRFATALAGFGLSKGDRVGIMLPNCPQYIIAAFAVLRHGAVIVNINPTYTARELLAIANDSGIRLLITLDALAPLALTVRSQTSLEEIVITSVAEYTPAAAAPPKVDGTRSLTELIQGVSEPKVIRVAIAAGDLAVLQYTGGTTGTPKGAMLTHANIFANVIQTETFMYRSRERGVARYLLVIPYFHIYAFTVGMMKGVWVGALQVLLPKYDVEQVLAAIKQYKPTYFPAVPTVFVSLLNHPRAKEFGLDKVRTFNSGGAPCPVEVIDQWERTFGRNLNEGYGLSETSPVTHTTPQLAARKPGCIGIPVLDTEIKIVDVETGTREMPIGEAGELCIAGPQVMKGYWQRRDETERVLRPDADGRIWFYTGDIATMDEDGFFAIVQRKKDMIIVDGFNVYPSEVETVLYMHPAVRLVAVIGVPDAYHGEVVKACVVLKAGASAEPADLIAHCKADLAPYKVPRQVELRNDLPMSAVGKILYRVLRDEIATATAPEATGAAEKR
jgi:long-chain acyl-CoA synthetase